MPTGFVLAMSLPITALISSSRALYRGGRPGLPVGADAGIADKALFAMRFGHFSRQM
jgi:hypothetical protein